MSFIPLGSPAILGHVSLLVAVVAAKFSSLSSIIVALHVSSFVTCITILQGIECVHTIGIEYGYPGLSRVGNCIDDWSISYWGCDHINLHPYLSCFTQGVIFSGSVQCTCLSAQSCLGLDC